MSWSACPVCAHNNPPQSFRCTSCAADFSDPDLTIAAVGYLIPMSDAGLSLPSELRFFLDGEIESGL